MALGQVGGHMQNDEVRSLANIVCKVNMKQIQNLNVSVKSIQLLEENIGMYLHDIGFDS